MTDMGRRGSRRGGAGAAAGAGQASREPDPRASRGASTRGTQRTYSPRYGGFRVLGL